MFRKVGSQRTSEGATAGTITGEELREQCSQKIGKKRSATFQLIIRV